ncbi:MAG: LCP family protein [Lachnospiraceae bacterium]|nr:LCP family protein [Lachnospiraceae bacterium]
MGKKLTAAQQKQLKKEKMRKKRYGRIALILLETFMILILSVGCYAVNILGKIERDHFSQEDLYVYGNDSLTIELLSGTETPEEQEQSNEGLEESSSGQETQTAQEEEQRATGAWAVQADATTEPLVIESENDFLSHQNLVNGYWNILLLGFDGEANASMSSGNYRADVIIVCSINAATKEVKLASVYRDTVMYQPTLGASGSYVKANDGVFSSLGGGMAEMVNMINLNLDLNIQDVVAVNWAALALVVNQLGGLELNILEEEVTSGHICGYLTETVEKTGIATNGQFTHGGLQWCDGPKVVAYCRNRKTIGSDFKRTDRQREVLEKLLQKAMTADLGTLIGAVSIITGNMYTSLSLDDMIALARDVSNYRIVGMTGFPEANTSTNSHLGSWPSYDITYPVVPTDLVSNVNALHQFLFGSAGVRSQNVQTISANINTISGF